LLLAGDITNSGRDGRKGDEGHNELGRFLSDYGLTGKEGRLRFPMYEGYGNHDYDPAENYAGWRDLYPDRITPAVQAVINRNARRIGPIHVASEGGHYSWDWGGVHIVNVNLFPGNEPSDHHHTSLVRDPYHSLDFLAADLEKHVGKTCRPVMIMSHYGFDRFSSDPLWWKAEQREAFWAIAKNYNVIGYIHGHDHGTSRYQWKGMDTFMVGSPYYNIDGLGHFAVFRIHGDTFEAADVAWDPKRSPTKAEFVGPTDTHPNRGWRFTKTIRRSCEDS
jgi:cytolysin (calcineurin-like family phosphatase)